jgi:hypothetical protein
MYAITKFFDKQEGVEIFFSWKYRIGLVLEENDLAKFIKENLSEPEVLSFELLLSFFSIY